MKKKKDKRLPNHIDEYLKSQENDDRTRNSRELFTGNENEIEFKSDLTLEEIHNINVLMVNDDILKNYKLKPVFSVFYKKFMRLVISKDRQSRGEFVRINSEQKADELLQSANNIQSIVGSRK